MKHTGNIRKYFRSDWNVICQVCGRKRKRSECILAYGSGNLPVVMSCKDGCADERHPLNSPPPLVVDGLPVPDARPEASDKFISQSVVSGMTWFNLPSSQAPVWFKFNLPNDQSKNPLQLIWTWFSFTRT
jgi:hypothetical protein